MDPFSVIQTIGIIASLVFTGVALRGEQKSRHAEMMLQVTSSHREIWSRLLDQPELSRVVSRDLDLTKQPITSSERLFVMLVIQHVSTVHAINQLAMLPELEHLEDDIAGFFCLPIPQAVWDDVRRFQNSSFTSYVQSCIGRTTGSQRRALSRRLGNVIHRREED